MRTDKMKKLAMILVIAGIIIFVTSGTMQAQEPSPDTPGAWLIYPDGTEHWVGNDRHSDIWGSDLSTSIHEALGYSGQYLCPGPNNWDICYWEFYNPPPEGSIIELRGPGVWTIGGDGAQGGQGREKVKSLVMQQNGIIIRGQDYDDGTGNMVRQEILFKNGATTALFYLEASDLTIENLHIRGTWPTDSGGYALAIGRYTMIGPDPHATGLIVRNNTFNNLRGMFDETPTVADLTVENNLAEDIYYNIFKKGVTFTGDNTVTDNTFNRVGQSQNYPALQILNHTGATCIDYNTFNGWKAGQYAIRGIADLSTPINLGTNNVFANQVGGSGATYQLYSLSAGGYAAGFVSSDDVILGCAPANTVPVADANGPYLVAVGQSITLDGSGSYDPDGDSLSYSWALDGPSLGAIADATFTAYDQAGITYVTLTVDDGRGGTDSDTAMLVVYDPAGGFVTGGGWIMSPEGAYKADSSLTGKANFGFVSKYKKGATVPEGNTEFVFQAGGLNFHSSSYDWLVVNQGGTNAQFKGMGTISGEGSYKFMLWAGDHDPDTFRIKIWEEVNGAETVVYDNDVDQPIGGGSIVVHKAK